MDVAFIFYDSGKKSLKFLIYSRNLSIFLFNIIDDHSSLQDFKSEILVKVHSIRATNISF